MNFNIVETVIDYGIKCILYTLWLGMARYVFEQAYGDQGVECDGLNMLVPGSGAIRRCGLIGGSASM